MILSTEKQGCRKKKESPFPLLTKGSIEVKLQKRAGNIF
jgi:hypothetical protein